MLKLPTGEIYKNEIKVKNCIAITDDPDREEIVQYFVMYDEAEKLIYVNGKVKKEYLRKDYE